MTWAPSEEGKRTWALRSDTTATQSGLFAPGKQLADGVPESRQRSSIAVYGWASPTALLERAGRSPPGRSWRCWVAVGKLLFPMAAASTFAAASAPVGEARRKGLLKISHVGRFFVSCHRRATGMVSALHSVHSLLGPCTSLLALSQ